MPSPGFVGLEQSETTAPFPVARWKLADAADATTLTSADSIKNKFRRHPVVILNLSETVALVCDTAS